MFNLEEITMRDGDLELLLKLVKGNPSFTAFVLSLLILLIGSIVPLGYMGVITQWNLWVIV